MAGAGRLSGATAIVTGARAGIGEAIAKKAAASPLRCLVDAQDSADAVLFLASDESRHITGVNLNVNAGSAII